MTFQVYAYLALGAVNTLFNIGLFAVSYHLIMLNAGKMILPEPLRYVAVEIATVISFSVSIISGFWLHKNFAFTHAEKNRSAVRKQFMKYTLVALQGQASGYLITKSCIVLLQIYPTYAMLLSTSIMLVVNYFLQRFFTFRKAGKTQMIPVNHAG